MAWYWWLIIIAIIMVLIIVKRVGSFLVWLIKIIIAPFRFIHWIFRKIRGDSDD